MATTTIQPVCLGKERGDAAGKSFLNSLGFDAKSIENILRVRDKIGLKDTKRSRPDLFSIASINVVLAIAGFDVEVFELVKLDEKERDTFKEYQKNCRFMVRRSNGIILEGPEVFDAFGAAASLRKTVVERCPDAGLDDISSTRISRGKAGDNCRYCGKKKDPDNISWYCDDTCKKLASGGHVFQIKNIDRLTDIDYKELITDRLASFNEKFGRPVSSKEFVAAIEDVLSANQSIGKESIFFYAYYIAARKNSSTYIAYHDMMSAASDEVKGWKGIKQLMLGRGSCKMENRIPSLFKKYRDLVVKQGIISAENATVIANRFDSLKAGEMTFRSNPKTVAVALLCELMNKMEIKHVKKDFFDAVKMSPATVWKVRGAARFLVDDPEGYRRKQQGVEDGTGETGTIAEIDAQEKKDVAKKEPEIANGPEIAKTEPEIVETKVVEKKEGSKMNVKIEAMDIDQIKEMIFGDSDAMPKAETVVPAKKAVPAVPVKKVARRVPVAEPAGKLAVFTFTPVETVVQATEPVLPAAQSDGTSSSRNVHAIYMDFENVYYIAKKMLGTRLNMDKLVGTINRAISNVDVNYESKNVVGRSYTTRNLMSLKAVFDATFEDLSTQNARELAGKFKWIPTPEPKFVRNLNTGRDHEVKANSDTYIVADAITDIIERSGEIGHVIIVSGDKDLSPILRKAKEKGMYVTVVGYHKYTSVTSRALANRVFYLD